MKDQEDSVEITDYDENEETKPAPADTKHKKTIIVKDSKEDEEEEWVEPVPKNLLENLFHNLDVNRNGVIDGGDLLELLEDVNLENALQDYNWEDENDITIEEIGAFLKEFNAAELKLILFHKKLKFVNTTYQQTHDGDIFALYRVFDTLNIDRTYLLVDNDKYLKADASGVSKERLQQILENLDRKSLLKLLSLQHVEDDDQIISWKNVFRFWKLGDIVFWAICAIVCISEYREADGGKLPCRSKVAHFFAAYIVLKAINYAFELCLTSCSCLFRHPRQFETRYIMSFLPFLSWLFSIVFRHACVLASLIEVASTTGECQIELRDDHTAIYTFFWWAMVYECVSLGLFTLAWTSLPFLTLYLLSIAIRPRVDDGKPNQGDLQEPLTEFCKEQFHKHIRSGDGFYEFFLGLTGLSTIVKKNDLARLLVTSSKEQKLSKKDVMLWSTDDVFNFLKSIDMEKYGQKFVDDKISGNLLLTYVDRELLRMGFGIKQVDADFIWTKINELRKPTTVGSWSVNEVCDWLCRIGMAQYMEAFRRQQIDGTMLLSHDDRLVNVLLTIPEFHRHKLIEQMKILRNEGAPMTVGSESRHHHLNYVGVPLAIQGAPAAQPAYIPNPNVQHVYAQFEERTGLRRTDFSDVRDIEALTPLVADEIEQEEAV